MVKAAVLANTWRARREWIAHFDADAFFASVEQAADARLRGLPMAVGGGRRGVISSASYEARAYGVRSAMPTRQACQLCPSLIVVPGHFELYEDFSERIFEMCRSLTPEVEQTSIDEGFLDMRGRAEDPQLSVEALRRLGRTVQGELKISISLGVAGNKLVSSTASKVHKPRGFQVVAPGAEVDFLDPLPVGMLRGVGPQTETTLAGLGVQTIGDLLRLGHNRLGPFLGRRTGELLEAARGIDVREVVADAPPARSFSRQETFDRETGDTEWVEARLKGMLTGLLRDLRAARQQARVVTIMLRYSDREEGQAGQGLTEPAEVDEEFFPLIRPLLKKAWSRRVCLRMAGVRLGHLYPQRLQQELFDTRRERLRSLAGALDELTAQYGSGAVRRASLSFGSGAG